MSIKSKIRSWIFPAKEDNFDNSYDYLLEFFNILDEEFGGLTDFLFNYRITKFFRTSTELSNSTGENGDYAMYIKNGDILQYDGTSWVVVDRVGRLPKIRQRDPLPTDIENYDAGESWINSFSGQVFKYVGNLLVDADNNRYSAVWVNQYGRVQYSIDKVKQFTFYPKINFRYKTKTLKIGHDGSPTFDEDEFIHFDGFVDSNGSIQFYDHDTHVDLYIQDYLIGTLVIKRKSVQSLIDLDFFSPEGGLPAKDDVRIYPWYERFERLMMVLELACDTDYDLRKTIKVDTKFNFPIEDILNDASVFNAFFDQNNHLLFSNEDVEDIKEKYRSFFAATHKQEMSVVEKQWALYLLGVCVAWEAYDGNVYYIDGSTMLADGNTEPTC